MLGGLEWLALEGLDRFERSVEALEPSGLVSVRCVPVVPRLRLCCPGGALVLSMARSRWSVRHAVKTARSMSS